MSDAETLDRMRRALNGCLEYVGHDADQYGTASTAGALLGFILEALGRPETADQYVVNRRKARAEK